MHTLSYVPPTAEYVYGKASLVDNYNLGKNIRSLSQVDDSNVMLVALAPIDTTPDTYPITNIEAVNMDTGASIASFSVAGFTMAGISFLSDGYFALHMHPNASGVAGAYRICVARFNVVSGSFITIVSEFNPYNAGFVGFQFFCLPSIARTSDGKLMVRVHGTITNHSSMRIYEVVGSTLTQRQTITRSDLGAQTAMFYPTSNTMAHDYLFYFVYVVSTSASTRVVLKYNPATGLYENYYSAAQSFNSGRRTLKVDLADIGPSGQVYLSEASTSYAENAQNGRGPLRHSLLRMDPGGPVEVFAYADGRTGGQTSVMFTSRSRKALHYNAARDIVFMPMYWQSGYGLFFTMFSANLHPADPIEQRMFDSALLHPFVVFRYGSVSNSLYELTAMMTRDCSKTFLSNIESRGIVVYNTNLPVVP